MAWNFRYYEEKRGHRRTGSRTVGSVGEAAFFAVLFVVGCAGIVAGILWLVIPEWRLNHGFIENTCTILQKDIGENEGENGPVFWPEIKIEYQVREDTYRLVTYDIHHRYSSNREEAQTILDRFVKGQKYPCWYDPADPSIAVLVRGYQWWIWLVFLVPVSFIAIGAGGLIYTILHWGKSAEFRAAMARRAQGRKLFEPAGTTEPRLPNVPDCSDVTSSPGTRLAYRLPLTRSPAWALFGLLAACLLWNGIVSFFVVAAVQHHLAGHPDWLLTLFVVPFLAIGIALLVCFVRQLLVTTGIGPTLVEVSDHPLIPGGQYRLFVSQSGRLKMNSLELFLICEEEATYRQGTNTRTETREVHRQSMFRRDAFEIHPGEPFEVECALDLPAGAMHSFKANHNEIHWKVALQGDIANWPDFERSFPVIVHPAAVGPRRERNDP